MAHHILIIGGGIGGTMTANHLVIKLYPELLSGRACPNFCVNGSDFN